MLHSAVLCCTTGEFKSQGATGDLNRKVGETFCDEALVGCSTVPRKAVLLRVGLKRFQR
jgi:hypothetical protein